MQNNPFESGNNNHGTLANAGQKRSGIPAIVKIIAVFTLIIAVGLGLFLGFSQAFSITENQKLDTSLDLPTGTDITLTSRDFESCHDNYESEEYPCFAFKAGIEFEPGLYTMVITPKDGETLDWTYLAIEAELDNYHGRDSASFHYSSFDDFPRLTSQFEIENVPLQEGSQIVITDLDSGKSFVDFAKEDIITFEFIAQSEYATFENNSGKTGFYPVGKAIAPGEYKFANESTVLLRAFIALSDMSFADLDKIDEMLLYDGSFKLEETDIFVAYDPNITLE